MPIYEYRCKVCGQEFEEVRSMSESDDPAVCPKCNKTTGERKPSVFCSSGAGGGDAGCAPGGGGFS